MVQPLPAKCIYCNAEDNLEVVSGDGGYGQDKTYACKDVESCLRRANQQVADKLVEEWK